MTGSAAARRAVLALMLAATTWSAWAWAQPGPHRGYEHKASRAAAATPKAGPEKAEAQEAAEDEAPAPINWTTFGANTPPFIALLFNFGLLAFAYYALGKKPIAAALQNRRDTIAKEIEEAQRMRAAAEERARVYQAKLEKLEDEVRSAREALVRAGEADRDRIIAEAEDSAERLRKDAQFLVEQEVKQARQDLWRDAVEVAVSAAQELLAARVTEVDQQRLAEEYLTDLAALKNAPDSRRPVEPAS